MADTMVRNDLRVRWNPAITGAFFALAVTIVLDLFGLAFGAGGADALSAAWLVLTPLVATFFGAAIAVYLSGPGRSAWLTGLMVWCVSLVAGSIYSAIGMSRAEMAGGALALAGLSALLGLCGAVIGCVAGRAVADRVAAGVERTSRRGDYQQQPVYPAPIKPEGDQPELRH